VPGVTQRADPKAATLSTEPILSPSAADPATSGRCSACGATLAHDQRYCLECGERRPSPSEFLRGGPPASPAAAPPSTPPGPAVAAVGGEGPGRSPMLTIIAGVGVLLLAMGVGVLIGRAGAGSGAKGPAQVITVAAGGASSATSGSGAGSGEETFTGDWPSGTKGYTVQLQDLPEGTTPAAVSQARSAASAKGAGAVGALKKAEYSSLSGSGYLIYSGVYHSKAEAQKALGTLRSKFPGASVVEVASGGASAGASGTPAEKAEAASAEKESKAKLSKPAPSSALKNLSHAKGKNYEEKSSQLPNVVETG